MPDIKEFKEAEEFDDVIEDFRGKHRLDNIQIEKLMRGWIKFKTEMM